MFEFNLSKMISFDFNTNLMLEDEMVLLRPLLESDLPNLKHFALDEPEIWEYSLTQVSGEENLKHYIKQAVLGRNEQKEFPFIVFDKRTNKYAGSTRFYDIQLKYQTLQLGYTWYGKDFQRTGLNNHCKFLLLQFAFEDLKMERVEFRADNKNLRSIKAMKKIGCTVEGVLRNHLPTSSGTRRDSIILSILKNEWYDSAKENLRTQL